MSALVEIGAGCGLLFCPSATVFLLIGIPLHDQAALILARVCGAGLLALGIVSWTAREDSQSLASRGLSGGMFVFNALSASVLIYARLGSGLHGPLLWPAVTLHIGMTVWCVADLLLSSAWGEMENNPPEASL